MSSMTMAEELDYWRARAHQAEQALKTDNWDVPLNGFTLMQSRILRILAKRQYVNTEVMITSLYVDRGGIGSIWSVRTFVSRIRPKLPKHIKITNYRDDGYAISSPEALQKFIAKCEPAGHSVNTSSIQAA